MLTFYGKLSEDFTKLLENEYNYDTIIEVGEHPDAQLFKVHSTILYQRSSYFQQKLTNTIKENNIFNIKLLNISVKAFNIIIKYIYGGTVSLENLETSDILNLLIAFNEFNISESIDCLQTLLIEDNTSWLRLNFFRIYQISFQNENFNALQQFCNDIIIKHPNLVFDSDDFITLQENALISLLKHDDLQLDESVIWDKVILWGKAQTPNLPSDYEQWNKENFNSLKVTLQNCLPHIRYFQIPGDDVLEKIQPYKKILEKNLWNDIITKLVSPDKSITFPILPPRKKLTTQLPSRKSISNDKENDSNNYLEIFSEPIYFPTNKKTIQHNELLLVTNELSITFQLKLKRHDSSWAPIFHKGEDAQHARNPAFWLSPNDSRPHPICSVNNNWNHHFATSGLELNKWYHIAYTLSEPQKRMEFYVNGKLVGSIEAKDIKFNEFPLKIGHSDKSTDFQGYMSNFRYYNIRLSTDEIFKDYISYHSNKLSQNRVKVRTKEIDSNDYLEIFSEPTDFPTNKKTIQHNELPSVTNELSMTFQLNLERHDSNWITILHKGEDAQHARNPALWLSPNDSKPHPICSVNSNWNHHFATSGLELNKWYHIAYTLSEPQKRMEFYLDGELVGYTDVKDIIFNEFPLKIGHSDKYTDFPGQMSNFRYYNIRLSADEIFKDYISYHSNELGFKGAF